MFNVECLMFKEIEIMKAMNITIINSIMKNIVKYLCAVVLLIGTSAHAWASWRGDFNLPINTGTLVGCTYTGPSYVEAGHWDDNAILTFNIADGYDPDDVSITVTTGGNNYYGDQNGTFAMGWSVSGRVGTLTLYASYFCNTDGRAMKYGSNITINLTVGLGCTSRTLTFANATVNKTYGNAAGKYQDYTLSSSGGTVTWSSTNTNVATVNSSGTVTLVGAGTTQIHASVPVNGTKCAADGYYTLNVAAVAPTVNNTHLTEGTVTSTSVAYSGGQVSNKGGAAITRYGYVLGTSSSVEFGTALKKIYTSSDVTLNTDFASKTLSGLTPNTTYYVRAFAYNGTAYGYGPAVSFTTLAEYDIDLNKNNSDEGSTDGLATVVENGTTIEIIAPTRTGYTIEGYYTTSGCATKVATAAGALQSGITVSATNWTNGSSQWVKAGGATFFTKWNAKEYTVTLNQNGGSGGSTGITATFGSAMPSATMPTTPPTGKTFDGYYYNSVKYYNADGSSAHVWDVDDDVTLVASWTTATPTLTIDEVDNIVISSTSPIRDEGQSTTVAYNTTVTLSHGEPASGYYWLDWNVYETGNEGNTVTVTGNQFTMPDFDVTVSANLYTGLVFSCAELTLTPHLVTAGTPIFITSTASKKVRSQDYITITGSGLTPSTALTFPGLDSKFEVLTSTGGAISTDASGAINVNAYIFYTPAADATTDGLDQMSGLTVSVGGAKPKQASLVQSIIGRHLPADFVIAGKKDGKWWAMPSNMASTGTPAPSEIAVDNINNPSIAYTAATNIYGLEGPVASNISGGNGQYVRLTMSIESSEGSGKPAPLFGTSGSEDASNSPKVGKSGTAIATNPLSEGWWWSLTQTNTSIANPQDAKYSITCANNSNTLSIKNSPFVWGLYKSGVEELRLIPASDVVFTEAYFVEWGQHGGVIEVDAEGVDATSVVAHLGEATSSAITLSQTLTSGKSRASKYNYTVNFGDGIDFAAAASNGAMLTLEWKKGSAVKAMSNIVVPKIVASNITINKANYPLKSDWNTEVHVLPGKTVTIDADYSPNPDVTIKELNIYPGATVVASTGTLIATTLVLRNGWSRAGTKKYDVARLHVTSSTATLKATNVYADWYIDYDQYYPIAVPWNATVENFDYRYCTVSPTVGPSGNIRMRYYDGNSRAINVQEGVGSGANWKQYGEGGNLPVPTTLTPSTGYAMTAKRPTGKAFSIIRMPLTLPSGTWGEGSWTTSGEAGNISTTHKDQISVTAHGDGSTPSYAQGWNLIANPYMSLHQGEITYTEGETKVAFVNIPDVDFKEYDQKPTAVTKLAPASAFLIQAPATGTITFGTANRKPSAPSYRTEEKPESIPEQQAYIVLSNEQSEDMMGILVSEKYTAEYEINADLEKLLSDGNSLRTYMRYNEMNMAYVAINEMLAKEWIPVNVRVPQSGEYTFSLHEASIAGELEGVYLIDYAADGRVTNLIEQDYTFVAEAGTIDGRFAINAIVGERSTPTDIDVVNGGGDLNSDKPFKFIYHDKVYIYHRGVIYDATGKRVREINK